ncbi:mitochondrial carrier domain-containing protein [Suillus subalutaceus]|uniref:mitochondrial carrier domain-containing protein n=1 Tax=Suillus subalutaceus TaxID=48586 RepID=UPI001B863777|nr:mitochondrial carrier domain-containing protein [Suillus subalutaceus]KAG1841128.1 mitochondrial carrier domain-containing protein [Suillus subalutaceus]
MSTQSQPAKQAQQLTPFASALAGALGACFRKRKDDLSMLSLLLEIFKQEGINGWYRGFAATMLNTFSMQYAYFFFYSFMRSSYIKRMTLNLPPAAGALSQIFTIPVSVIATRQQVGRSARASSQSFRDEAPMDESLLAVAREIIREDGVTGLWLGIKPGMVLTVNPAITYGVYERLKSLMLLASSANGKLTPGTSFLLGAFSKTLATIVRIQARSTDKDASESEGLPGGQIGNTKPKAKQAGAVSLLLRVLRKEGFVGWYQGMSAQIIKAVISQALLFVSKEQFEHWALALMVLFAKFTSRS